MAVQKICLGTEIAQDALTVALVEPERKNIIKIDVIPTSGNSLKDVSIYSSVLNSWVRSQILPKINAVSVAFSACDGITRLVTIPKVSDGAYNYVEWEFVSVTDFSLDNYKLDVFFYPNSKKPERAIVSAMQKDIVNSFCSEEIEKSGYRPDCLISDVCALSNLLEVSEGLDSSPKCILKADKRSVICFWSNNTGPLAIKILPKDVVSVKEIVSLLENGFNTFSKAKRNVKFCGELSSDTKFLDELSTEVKKIKKPIEVKLWNSINKFSLAKNEDFSKLSQCLGAVGAAISC